MSRPQNDKSIEYYVAPSRVAGAVTAPPSKSMMIRAVAAAFLARGVSEILNPSLCDDALAALSVSRALGAKVQRKNRVRIWGGLPPKSHILRCGESGLTMRMFASIAALYDKEITLTAQGSLRARPMEMTQALRELGARCATDNGSPPLRIRGPLRGGKLAIDASTSSQFLSGLLMALPLCMEDSEILVRGLRSRPYMEMTLSLLSEFGIRIRNDGFERFRIPGGQSYVPRTYRVEGDWSGAAFMLVAGAIAGRVTVTGLRADSPQADKAILEALQAVGAQVRVQNDAVSVAKTKLTSFEFDVAECPDLFPPLAALAANCKGKSLIRGTGRLKYKESDRVAAIAAEFSKIGGRISVLDDAVAVEGCRIKGGDVDSRGDHRIAMACAVAALASREGVTIESADCVAKSYPRFFDELKKISGRNAGRSTEKSMSF